jgi:hypothetical protein
MSDSEVELRRLRRSLERRSVKRELTIDLPGCFDAPRQNNKRLNLSGIGLSA